jgi:hypothetical protein
MECYIAENNDTVALQLVTDMGAGAGETNCFECAGTGVGPGTQMAKSASASIAKVPEKPM